MDEHPDAWWRVEDHRSVGLQRPHAEGGQHPSTRLWFGGHQVGFFQAGFLEPTLEGHFGSRSLAGCGRTVAESHDVEEAVDYLRAGHVGNLAHCRTVLDKLT